MVKPRTADDDLFDRLHRLIRHGDLIGLRKQLAAGVDPKLRNRFGWTLLMLAAMHGRGDVVDLLIEHGSDPRATNDFGDTAESLAANKGHQRLVDRLRSVTHGATPTI